MTRSIGVFGTCRIADLLIGDTKCRYSYTLRFRPHILCPLSFEDKGKCGGLFTLNLH